MDWKPLLLSFNGRIGRKPFWTAFVLVMLASLCLNFIPMVGPVLGLVTLWPQVAIHAKRLHDMGWSAWIMLAPASVSIAAALATLAVGPRKVEAPGVITPALATLVESLGGVMAVTLISLAVELGFLLWVGLTPGKRDANRFGVAPA
jgi:uncharacterized membrane protein YhaH (DUF805 family)